MALLGVVFLIISQAREKKKTTALNAQVDAVEGDIHNKAHAALAAKKESETRAEKAKEINAKADKKIQELKSTNPSAAAVVDAWNSKLRDN